MNHPKVSIIILNWNGLEDTIECLESLKRVNYPDYEVILVDNASSGDDVRVLKEKYGDYIHVIVNDNNYGFAKGNNIGMSYALSNSNPASLILLNNDTIVAPDFLDELIKVAESDSKIGIVGPKLYYYDFEGRKDVIWSAGGRIMKWRRWIYEAIGKNDQDLPKYQDVKEVDWISGSAMMIKRSVINKISFLDSDYFFGDEDVDYCLKAQRHGFKIVYAPAAKVWHKVGKSRSKADATKNRLELGFMGLYSHYRIIRKNFPLSVYIYHLLILPAILLHWGFSYLVKHRPRLSTLRQ